MVTQAKTDDTGNAAASQGKSNESIEAWEYKLALNLSHLAKSGTFANAATEFAEQVIVSAGADRKLTWTAATSSEAATINIVFFDTPSSDFRANSFLMRVRADDPGVPRGAPHTNLTLKFRVEGDPKAAFRSDVHSTPCVGFDCDHIARKQEVVLPKPSPSMATPDALAKPRLLYAHDNELNNKKHGQCIPAEWPTTVGGWQGLFPGLVLPNVDGKTPVSFVSGVTVVQQTITMGTVAMETSDGVDVDAILWSVNGGPLAAEASFTIKPSSKQPDSDDNALTTAARKLYKAMRSFGGSTWFDLSGATKTSALYGYRPQP